MPGSTAPTRSPVRRAASASGNLSEPRSDSAGARQIPLLLERLEMLRHRSDRAQSKRCSDFAIGGESARVLDPVHDVLQDRLLLRREILHRAPPLPSATRQVDGEHSGSLASRGNTESKFKCPSSSSCPTLEWCRGGHRRAPTTVPGPLVSFRASFAPFWGERWEQRRPHGGKAATGRLESHCTERPFETSTEKTFERFFRALRVVRTPDQRAALDVSEF